MRCDILYLGKVELNTFELCSVMSVQKTLLFVERMTDVDLAMLDAALQLSQEEIKSINDAISRYKVPLLLYVDGDCNPVIVDECNHTGIIRAQESCEISKAVIRNIVTNNRRMKELLKDSDLLGLFLKYNLNYVFFKDENARVLKLSDNYETMLGIPVEEAIGKNMMELFPSELARSMVDDDLRILTNDESVEVIEELHGRYYKTSKFPIHREGMPSLLAGFTIDITDMKQAEQMLIESKKQVEKLTVTDVLLSISNRRGFILEMNNEINRINRYGSKSTLIILDIDEFKKLNDKLGHFKADDFLRDLVSKVNGILRTSDFFGRLGGDEFGIICVSTPLEKGMVVAKRIQEVVNQISVVIDGEPYTYSVSIGLTEINQEHIHLERLLHRADLALYQAKRDGRNCVRVLK
ncbi:MULTISPECIES: GGDEF domain-containing protein [unclassified Fusibacter]|uniref:sensor domain-containing diguanylate cyclase n=1 Tax=unclassified Fusibacter TaxID=2624464 RepID=UPI0010116F72|nr:MULTISPECIES: GGDEF domain-containing protein [unclassified Fusibacter]MCK8060325.1 GGDEF domain-containing protein [Fusibacter sp. A2]NPE20386.1 GGDEF domain-containing protein [Fusibacter sp. A1]RXV63591.1 diguanylate cyclase [Fusibacter sp. A1]